MIIKGAEPVKMKSEKRDNSELIYLLSYINLLVSLLPMGKFLHPGGRMEILPASCRRDS